MQDRKLWDRKMKDRGYYFGSVVNFFSHDVCGTLHIMCVNVTPRFLLVQVPGINICAIQHRHPFFKLRPSYCGTMISGA